MWWTRWKGLHIGIKSCPCWALWVESNRKFSTLTTCRKSSGSLRKIWTTATISQRQFPSSSASTWWTTMRLSWSMDKPNSPRITSLVSGNSCFLFYNFALVSSTHIIGADSESGTSPRDSLEVAMRVPPLLAMRKRRRSRSNKRLTRLESRARYQATTPRVW